MPLFVFVCPEGHETERLTRDYDLALVSCACGQAARRSEVNQVGVTGFTPIPRDERNHRQAYREYKEAIGEVGYAYQKRWDAGEPVKMPDYAGIAERQMKAQGG